MSLVNVCAASTLKLRSSSKVTSLKLEVATAVLLWTPPAFSSGWHNTLIVYSSGGACWTAVLLLMIWLY